MNLDLYAGAGGWDEAARQLGLDTVGLELWHDACVTAVRAGHPRIRCDIATYPTAPFAGRVTACPNCYTPHDQPPGTWCTTCAGQPAHA